LGGDASGARSGSEVAHPDGYGKTWNAGNGCGPAQSQGVDDVGFLHRLVEQLGAEDGVDQHRVYAVGMSNGAMMTYARACARPDDLAGIGPGPGALVTPRKPPPTLQVGAIHGTADRDVPH